MAEISVPTKSAPPVAGNKSKSIKQARKEIDYFPDSVKDPVPDELATYLGGKYKLPSSEADQCLQWWKVIIFHHQNLEMNITLTSFLLIGT
jgi:hypothetical protein